MLDGFLDRFRGLLRIPLAIAIGLSGYVLIADYLTSGATTGQFGITAVRAAAFYLGFAIIATALAAYFGPHVTTRARAALVGFFGGVLFGLAVYHFILLRILPGPLRPSRLLLWLVFLGLMPGAYIGALFWKPPDIEE